MTHTPWAMGQAVVNADVLHADEAGLGLANKQHCLHVLAMDKLTWTGGQPKPGTEAFLCALGLL